ncbi:capsule biosynthesis protein CapK [Arsukibacterium sp. MJ3]|uniref:phenylacetate--CoA ligase family protein n=1 Tax=Arsukibacterium sp. MJ3 TaxID=1632859 RepID=UPI00062737C5|nr:AMP-binding protein [Arsukibacterium sp. MJ3]KKO49305.1 capsule biosynthesis protein CapK [Arsukibacterium sp. MJ3]
MTNVYTKLISNILFPLHERLKSHTTYNMLARLEKSQWLSPEQINTIQQQRLQVFVANISQHSPYYQQLFAANNLKASDITTAADLAKLPFLTKQRITDNQQTLCSQPQEQLQRYNTGGSSGVPLIFYMGKARVSHDVAAKLRATRWWDVDIGDPEVVLWGSPIELGKQDRFKKIRDGLFRSYLLPAFEFTPAHIDAYLRQLQQLKPKMLFGYPSVIHQLALAAEARQLNLSQLAVKVVFVTSEMLFAHQRAVIERVFQCPVANGYGARDAGFIAHQCPAGSLHISAEDIIVEIIGDDDKVVPLGESGEIVITHLQTQAFPFVRYRTGDIGQLATEPCSCGRGLPVLAQVNGRTTDFMLTTAGDKLHALALIYVLRDLTEIKQFKIIQHALTEVEVQLVTGAPLSSELTQYIIKQFQQRLGNDCTITLQHLANIASLPNGKHRYVESKLAH